MDSDLAASAKGASNSVIAGIQNAPLVAAISVLLTVFLTASSAIASTNYHSGKTQQACTSAVSSWDGANNKFSTAAQSAAEALQAATADTADGFSTTEDGAKSVNSVTQLVASHAGKLTVTCSNHKSAAQISQQAEDITADAQSLSEATDSLNTALAAYTVSAEYSAILAKIDETNASIKQAQTDAQAALKAAASTDGYTSSGNAKVSSLQSALSSLSEIKTDQTKQDQSAIDSMRTQLSEATSNLATVQSATTALNDDVTAYQKEAEKKAAEAKASQEAKEAERDDSDDNSAGDDESTGDDDESAGDDDSDDVVLTALFCKNGTENWIYHSSDGWTRDRAIQDAQAGGCTSWN